MLFIFTNIALEYPLIIFILSINCTKTVFRNKNLCPIFKYYISYFQFLFFYIFAHYYYDQKLVFKYNHCQLNWIVPLQFNLNLKIVLMNFRKEFLINGNEIIIYLQSYLDIWFILLIWFKKPLDSSLIKLLLFLFVCNILNSFIFSVWYCKHFRNNYLKIKLTN